MPTRVEPGWEAWVARWKVEQEAIRRRVLVEPMREVPRFVAGVDAAFTPDQRDVLAAAVVWDRGLGRVVEVGHAKRPAGVPYVPGYLSFREGKAVLAALRELKHEWGVICFDGQGAAHPRRCGIAVHMGVLLGMPTIGVAKSRLIGTYGDLEEGKGAEEPLIDRGERVGVAMRTKDGCNPIFVSPGNRMDMESAVRVVRACVGKYRVPEPTRQADIEVAKFKASLGGRRDEDTLWG